jgi:hypothetical protein
MITFIYGDETLISSDDHLHLGDEILIYGDITFIYGDETLISRDDHLHLQR